jgi:hypothetical protein
MKKLAVPFVLLVVLFGCQGQQSSNPPVHINQNMFDQPRYNVQAKSTFFSDSTTMRTPPDGTIAQGNLREDSIYFTGMIKDTIPVEHLPIMATHQLLQRGQERFNIYCSPCHSRIGDGNGVIIQRGMTLPPSYFDPRLLAAPDGHFFDVITNGIRNMAPYKYQIPVDDRWAITAYIRMMQTTRDTVIVDKPSETIGGAK